MEDNNKPKPKAKKRKPKFFISTILCLLLGRKLEPTAGQGLVYVLHTGGEALPVCMRQRGACAWDEPTCHP